MSRNIFAISFIVALAVSLAIICAIIDPDYIPVVIMSLLVVFIPITIFWAVVWGVIGKNGNINRAMRLHEAAGQRMGKHGQDDAKVLIMFINTIEKYKKLLTKMNNNTATAYHYLGRVLFTGPERLRNYAEAAECFTKAIAIYEEKKEKKKTLAWCYNELGTVQYRMGDYDSSFANYHNASELAVDFSADEAMSLWMGKGVIENFPKALSLFKEAVLAGRDAWANVYAVQYQMEELTKDNCNNKGIEAYMASLHAQRMQEAAFDRMAKLKKAAEFGYPPAQVDLWIIYRDKKEFAAGMPWLQKAAQAGYPFACFHLGLVYHKGVGGVKVDLSEAHKWYEKAALEGMPTAQSNLGILYYMKKIQAPSGILNSEMAYYWWNEASQQGDAVAEFNLQLVGHHRLLDRKEVEGVYKRSM